MLRILKNQKGFTLIELVIIIILIGVLAAVAIPKYVDLRDTAIKTSAQATLDAGRAGIMLDFADDVLGAGTYVSPFAGPVGAKMVAGDKTVIEGFLEASPNYPGTYDSGPDEGFRWWLIALGSTSTASSAAPPELAAAYDTTCAAADSLTTTLNDDCDVRAF